MNRLIVLLVCFFLATCAASAQPGGTLPNGFPQDSNGGGSGSGDVTADYLILTADPTLINSRLLTYTARFAVTDNGPGNTYIIELATVDVAHGGTGGTTQQTAVNGILNFAGKATGDLVKYNGTNWVRVPLGTANQILAVNAGGTDIAYTSAGSIPNAAAEYVVGASDGTLPNADVLTQGSGIAIAAGSNLATVAVDATVLRTTGAQSVAGVKTFTNDPALSSGTHLVFKGTSFDTTITRTDASAARSFNLPDIASGDFIINAGNQTIAGVKTFSSAPKLSTNTLTSSTGNTITFVDSADTIVNLASAQTMLNKTLTSPIIGSSLILQQATANYTVSFNNPGSARNYFVTDVGGSADFVMLGHNDVYTNGGVFYADSSTAKITAAGTSGKPLVSAGAAAPSFATLGGTGGGTGQATTTAGDLLVGAAANTWSKLAKGTANQVLAMDGTGTNVTWAAAGSGSVTSVAMTGDNVIYNTAITGSPITTSGTLVPVLKSQAAGTMLGNYTAGSAAPTFAAPTGTNGIIVTTSSKLNIAPHLGMTLNPSRRQMWWQPDYAAPNYYNITGVSKAAAVLTGVAAPSTVNGLVSWPLADTAEIYESTPGGPIQTSRELLPTFYTNFTVDIIGASDLFIIGLFNQGAPVNQSANFGGNAEKGYALVFDKDNNTHFQLVTSNGVSNTAVDTGITAVAGTKYEMFLDNSVAGTIDLWLNNVKVATSTTNLPALTDLLDWQAVKTGASGHTLYIGRVYLESN